MPGNMYIPPRDRSNPTANMALNFLTQLAIAKRSHQLRMKEKEDALAVEREKLKLKQKFDIEDENRIKPYREITIGGRPAFIDHNNKITFAPPDKDASNKRPTSIEEFEYAQQNPAFARFLKENQRQGQKIEIGIAQKGETAATQKFGEKIGETAASRLKMADEARMQNFQLQQMEDALNRGASTGFGSETFLTMRKGLEGFGIDTGDLSDQELMKRLSNEMVLRLRNPESGLGLPGSTSNQDLLFLKETAPGLATTERGNLKIIDSMKRVNKFKMDIVKEQQKIIRENNGVVPGDLDERLTDFADKYRVFSKEDKADFKRLTSRVINTGVHKNGRKVVQLEDGSWEFANAD